MRKPTPEARITALGIVAVSVFILIGLGVCIGAGFGMLTRDIYVPVLVPLAMGATTGMCLGMWVFLLEISRRRGIFAVCTLVWIGVVTAFHWVEYRVSFMTAVQSELSLDTQTEPLSHDGLEDNANRALLRGVGASGFLGFLKLRARSGVRLRLSGQLLTGYAPGIVAWLVDVLIGGLLAFRVPLRVHKRRYLAGIQQ